MGRGLFWKSGCPLMERSLEEASENICVKAYSKISHKRRPSSASLKTTAHLPSGKDHHSLPQKLLIHCKQTLSITLSQDPSRIHSVLQAQFSPSSATWHCHVCLAHAELQEASSQAYPCSQCPTGNRHSAYGRAWRTTWNNLVLVLEDTLQLFWTFSSYREINHLKPAFSSLATSILS